MAQADDWSNDFWTELILYLNVPNEQRYVDLVQKVVIALADGDRALAKRDAKNLAYLIKSEEGRFAPLNDKNNLIAVDPDADLDTLTKRVLETADMAMDMGAAAFDEIEDDRRYDPENGGLDLNGQIGDEDGNAPPPGGDNPPPPGPGGDGPGGPGGDARGGGTPPSDDRKSGGDDKKSKKTAPGELSKGDVEKVAQMIRDNDEKAGRETARVVAQVMIENGNGFPINDLAAHIYDRAVELIVAEDARAAARRGQVAEDDDAAQPQRNTMDRVAREQAAETVDRPTAGVDQVWAHTAFQGIRSDVVKADDAGREEDAKRLLAEALQLAKKLAEDLGVDQPIGARDILVNVFPPERIQEYDARMAEQAQAEERGQNRAPRLSDYAAELGTIAFLLAEASPEEARAEAERLATTLRAFGGEFAKIDTATVLKHVLREEKRMKERYAAAQRPEADPQAQDRARSSEEILPEDSVSQRGGQRGGTVEIPGAAVRNVAMALNMAGEAKAKEIAEKLAGMLQEEVPGTVGEIAETLLERARVDAERMARADGAPEQPARAGGNGFLAHVTDVDRFMKFGGMFQQVAQMVADKDPKTMDKAKALVKTFRDDKKIFKESATPKAFLEFCIEQARLQERDARDGAERQDDNPYGPDEVAAEERPGGSTDTADVDRALANDSKLRSYLGEMAKALAKGNRDYAHELAGDMAGELQGRLHISIARKTLLAQIFKAAKAMAKAMETDGSGGAGAFSIPRALQEDAALARSFQRLVQMIKAGDRTGAGALALQIAKAMIKTFGLTMDHKKLTAEILRLAQKAAGRQSTDSSDDHSKPSDDGSGKDPSTRGSRPDTPPNGSDIGRPESLAITITMRDVKQTNWSAISSLYFDTEENAEEMRAIASEIVKKGEDNAGVEKSAKDLLGKAKKAKKGKFRNVRHLVAAIRDAVYKRAMGKKVTKPIKASDIPGEDDDRNAA